MTILITGGAGFIGSNLIEVLLKGSEVICIDNFNDFYSPEQKRKNVMGFLAHPRFRLIEGDISNKAKVSKAFEKSSIDAIVHLAAYGGVRPSIKNPALYIKNNILGTSNMLELARDYKINKFIFASSSSVYGNQARVPFSEGVNVNTPISPYAATKLAGEQLCYTFHHLYGISTLCLRFFTVYGPRQRPDLAIYKFTKQIYEDMPLLMYGKGDTMRDYTYISDIIDGIIRAINYDKSGFEIINLGDSKPIQLKKLVELIENKLEKKANIEYLPLQSGDMLETYAKITKAQRLLGYTPKVNIDEGISRFVNWYLESIR